MKTQHDDPAFPEHKFEDVSGLNIREYFAIKALAGILANSSYKMNIFDSSYPAWAATQAIIHAEELIDQLNNTPPRTEDDTTLET